jgi:anaerobic ribonucleoside-triphosphate reductase activating protein
MLNGDGLRVVLWLSGCNHKCKGCQNPQTWDINSGIPFDKVAEEELLQELSKDYISGITFTGGDPLHENNLDGVLKLVNQIRLLLPKKTIWLYTGYTWDYIFDCINTVDIVGNIKREEILKHCDVLVDGRYEEDKRDLSLKFRGSSNQRLIDVKKSLEQGELILWDTP